MSNVQDEQVRFEESYVFGSGEAPQEIIRIPEITNLIFLTDGYGPSSSFHQVRLFFGPGASHSVENSDFLSASSQTEDVNGSNSAHL